MKKLLNSVYFAGMNAKAAVKKLWKEERGDTNIIAIIIILAIVIALAIIFRGAIIDLFNSIWNGTVTPEVNEALGQTNGI